MSFADPPGPRISATRKDSRHREGGQTAWVRRILLSALPKLLLSRGTGLLTRTPLPRRLRGPVHRWFARRYGCELGEVAGELADYRSLAAFFQRPLRAGARPIAAGASVLWPCDGRIVSCGPITGNTIPQIKGVDYTLDELLHDRELAAALAGGSQATIYLSPRDYHRVHAPFDATWQSSTHQPGSLFPVNPPAVASIAKLFARNERLVLRCKLPDGRPAVLVMVAALNVGDIVQQGTPPRPVHKGEEMGRFGFGSTVIVLLPPGTPCFAVLPAESPVRMGEAARLVSA